MTTTPTTIVHTFGGMIFDATLTESHSLKSEVTKHPTESGEPIADHVILQPDEFTIKAGVTDTPIAIAGIDVFASAQGRSIRCYDLLKQLRASRQPFVVQTRLANYQNVICTDLSTDQEAGKERAMIFTAKCEVVRIVNSSAVTYTRASAAGTQSLGTKAAAPVNPNAGLKSTLVNAIQPSSAPAFHT